MAVSLDWLLTRFEVELSRQTVATSTPLQRKRLRLRPRFFFCPVAQKREEREAKASESRRSSRRLKSERVAGFT
jgi:hypothetical protein